MRNIFLVLALCWSFMSCSNDDEFRNPTFPQKWKLVKMTGSFAGSERAGNDMSWQETYTFNKDSTFLKTRDTKGVTTQASGTFTVHRLDRGEYLFVLSYPQENDLIGTCYSDQLREDLILRSHRLIDTWSECDGPGLEYARVE